MAWSPNTAPSERLTSSLFRLPGVSCRRWLSAARMPPPAAGCPLLDQLSQQSGGDRDVPARVFPLRRDALVVDEAEGVGGDAE